MMCAQPGPRARQGASWTSSQPQSDRSHASTWRPSVITSEPCSRFCAKPPETPPPSTTSPSTAATAPVTVRVMTPDDAIAVARCTYAVYGYTLPDDYLYFPDRMCEMLRGGLLEVYIGTTSDGEVASCLTCEVAHAGAPVGYLGEGLVDPRFRHHGLLEQMLRFAQRRASERGML